MDASTSPFPAVASTSPASDPAFITAEEASVILRVNPKTLYDAIREGQVPGVVRLGKAIRINRAALVAWAPGSACPTPGVNSNER